MPMVSVRLDEEDLAFVRSQTDNVSEFIRDLMRREVRKQRALEASKRLARRSVAPHEPVAKTIRDQRDAR